VIDSGSTGGRVSRGTIKVDGDDNTRAKTPRELNNSR
jgi:hypothetical protein